MFLKSVELWCPLQERLVPDFKSFPLCGSLMAMFHFNSVFCLVTAPTHISPSPTVTFGPTQICLLSTFFSHAAFYSQIPLYLTPLFSHLSV